ncbi:polyphenol oxidase family protein [Terrilactibacillus sp. S3-3]|nr:polyphenol oxidase family protein [Terrilactibacillus sp. S3-3]
MALEPFSIKTKLALEMERIAVSGQKMIISGISVRSGGVSLPPFRSLNMGFHVHDDPKAVAMNRRRLSEQLSFPLENWVCAEQVHGTGIAEVTPADAGAGAIDFQTVLKGIDGLFTTETGLLLALCFADCVPIYFYSKSKPAVGLLHAGWRGTVQMGAPKMIEMWRGRWASLRKRFMP